MADTSKRTEGMINASADYYQESEIFKAIQNAQALEYDRIEINNKDLALQLSPLTATWGLIYWEEAVGLPMKDNTDYEGRRPAVLASLAKSENFNVKMIRTYVQVYGKQSTVEVNVPDNTVIITITDGLPALLSQLQERISQIIHAHLEPIYKVKTEKNIPIFIGSALYNSVNAQMAVAGLDPDKSVPLVDELGNVLVDENEKILID